MRFPFYIPTRGPGQFMLVVDSPDAC